jgi:hypothetical protein
MEWNGLIWLRIGTDGGFIWTNNVVHLRVLQKSEYFLIIWATVSFYKAGLRSADLANLKLHDFAIFHTNCLFILIFEHEEQRLKELLNCFS